MGDPAELSATDLANAIRFARQIVEAVTNDAVFPTQMSGDIDPQMTLLIMAQAIIELHAFAQKGAFP